MAQTRRKRSTKHRGNAAGAVVARGRTGRKPTAAETKQSSRSGAAARRAARLDKPPTWRQAAGRAALASGIFLIAVLLLSKGKIVSALALGVFAFAIYVPMSYYTDLFIYRRRQRRKEAPR
jgi:hypothetical protein